MKQHIFFVFCSLFILPIEGCDFHRETPVQEGKIWVKEAGVYFDQYEVSVQEFGEFLKKTRYTTTADSMGWSAFFDTVSHGWVIREGANWECPDGQHEASLNHPVTQVSYYDACAYCKWKHGRLPTAEEWDRAAGDKIIVGNIWQGKFPIQDIAEDGYKSCVAPVGSFEPNAIGIHDLFGNVWEWTASDAGSRIGSYYVNGHLNKDEIGHGKIIKGGSFLCEASVCEGYKPDHYQRTPENSGAGNLGFRCVYEN